MSPLPTILDAEALVGAWLREHDDMVDLDAHVGGKTPNSRTRPWIRVTQLDARPIVRARFEHVMDYTLQFDCFASSVAMADYTGQAEATLLGRRVRAVLKATEGTVADGAAVSRVRFSTHMRSPDTTTEPATERVILVADILMRPA